MDETLNEKSNTDTNNKIAGDNTALSYDFKGFIKWLRGRDPLSVVFAVAIFAAIYWLFQFFGSDSNITQEGVSLFNWIGIQWRNEKFRYNGVMLLVSAYVIYSKRKELMDAPKSTSYAGVSIVIISLIIHFIAFRAQQPRVSLLALVGTVWGSCYAMWGREVAKILLFPAAYSALCFTVSLLDLVTMPLRLAATSLAEFLLHGAGIAAVRRGTVIYSSAGGGFTFDVADACSGLRSLTVMTALAAPYAYFTLKGLWRKWILFFLSVPLAMLANTLRIFTLAVVAELIGQKLAMALYHDFSGYLVFIIAMGLLIASASLLEKDWSGIWTAWRKRVGISRT